MMNDATLSNRFYLMLCEVINYNDVISAADNYELVKNGRLHFLTWLSLSQFAERKSYGAVTPWRFSQRSASVLRILQKKCKTLQNVQICSDLRTFTPQSSSPDKFVIRGMRMKLLKQIGSSRRSSTIRPSWSYYRPNCLRLKIQALVQNCRLRCPLLHLRRARKDIYMMSKTSTWCQDVQHDHCLVQWSRLIVFKTACLLDYVKHMCSIYIGRQHSGMQRVLQLMWFGELWFHLHWKYSVTFCTHLVSFFSDHPVYGADNLLGLYHFHVWPKFLAYHYFCLLFRCIGSEFRIMFSWHWLLTTSVAARMGRDGICNIYLIATFIRSTLVKDI